MNKKRFYIAGVIVLLLSMASPVVFANRGGWERGGGHGDGFKHSLPDTFFYKAHAVLKNHEEIGLSAEQVETIRNLKLDAKKSLIRQMAEVQILDMDIQSQLRADKFDAESVRKLVDQKYEAKKALSKTIVESYSKLRSTVNEQQWEAFQKIKSEKMKKYCPMHSRGDKEESGEKE